MMIKTWATAAALLAANTALAGNGLIKGNADDWSLTEHWSDYTTGVCQYDSNVFGTWKAVFDGGGCTQVLTGTTKKLELSPAVATSSGVTHAALVAATLAQGGADYGAGQVGDLYLSVNLKTVQQLRTGSSPNPWEVGWVTWNGKLDSNCSCNTFNYFIPKSNGYELGMVTTGGQVFLASGSTPTFPTNNTYTVEVYQSNAAHNGPGNIIDVYVNGTQIVHYTGSTVPFTSGWFFGPYVEDSKVDFWSISGTRI